MHVELGERVSVLPRQFHCAPGLLFLVTKPMLCVCLSIGYLFLPMSCERPTVSLGAPKTVWNIAVFFQGADRCTQITQEHKLCLQIQYFTFQMCFTPSFYCCLTLVPFFLLNLVIRIVVVWCFLTVPWPPLSKALLHTMTSKSISHKFFTRFHRHTSARQHYATENAE